MRRTAVTGAGKQRATAAALLCVCSALAISGCTSTLSALDTGLFASNKPPQPVPALTSETNVPGVPAPRPTVSLQAQPTTEAPENQELAAFTPSSAESAAQTTALAVPQTPVATPPTAQSVTPVQPTLPSDTADPSITADTRIAQANGETTVSAQNGIAAQQTPVVASVVTGSPTVQSPNRLGLFNRFFNRERANPQPPAAIPTQVAAAPPAPAPTQAPVAATTIAPSTSTSIALTNEPTQTPAPPPPTVITAAANGASLPGVDKERLLGFDQAEEPQAATRPVQVASAAGLARLAPNGLRVQHSGVDVACLKPALVRVLKRVERKFGKPVVVTSGYRSPSRNSNARGAKNSLHIYCAAADIQIEGVTKWELASYLRSMPGRGGVGTYCHTRSVHIDIGPKRDWNWRCRRG